jgi:hypothetical protein
MVETKSVFKPLSVKYQMLNNLIINSIILFIILEIYEVSWQKAPTLIGMLVNMYRYYAKSVVLFLIMQPTFYFSIGFAIFSNYSPAALTIVFLKTVDIATKIILLEQVFIKKEISQEMSVMLLTPLNSFLPYMGLLIYPPLIYLTI